MKQISLSLYYTVILAALIGQVVFTVYNQSVLVNRADRMHELEAAKQQLVKEQLALRNELSQQTALTALSNSSATQDYQPVSTTVVVERSLAVADSSF